MSLRFRIGDHSSLGRRLRSLPEDQRRLVFEAVVSRGLEIIESPSTRSGTACDPVVRALERVDSRLARIEAILVGDKLGLHSDAAAVAPDSLDDHDIRRLVGTLNGLSAH